MATAFTKQEKNVIRDDLKQAARQCAISLGMRKTTVEQLAQAADISKGAFYKFYDSKELLFFEVLEDMHTEIYGCAEDALNQNSDLPAAQRAAEAVLAACRLMEQNSMLDFWENDLAYLLRKVPEAILKAHYHSDEEHIKELFHKSGLFPAHLEDLVAATVRALMLTVSHRNQIGRMYPQVLECLVHGAFEQIFHGF